MPLSKSTRILLLLAIDSAFFLLELGVGYGVHSLALVADSFHMVSKPRRQPSVPVLVAAADPCRSTQLNDVLSLCVGLWAVKVARNKPSSEMYTYGVGPDACPDTRLGSSLRMASDGSSGNAPRPWEL